MVGDPQEVTSALRMLLGSRDFIDAMGHRALNVFRENQGAVSGNQDPALTFCFGFGKRSIGPISCNVLLEEPLKSSHADLLR